ncbi:hypothetical protein J6590_037035 [Homalodisca vitripennis]|nr:hypothetical protein J6590_037035 [Homalodisca vitripennis]
MSHKKFRAKQRICASSHVRTNSNTRYTHKPSSSKILTPTPNSARPQDILPISTAREFRWQQLRRCVTFVWATPRTMFRSDTSLTARVRYWAKDWSIMIMRKTVGVDEALFVLNSVASITLERMLPIHFDWNRNSIPFFQGDRSRQEVAPTTTNLTHSKSSINPKGGESNNIGEWNGHVMPHLSSSGISPISCFIHLVFRFSLLISTKSGNRRRIYLEEGVAGQSRSLSRSFLLLFISEPRPTNKRSSFRSLDMFREEQIK